MTTPRTSRAPRVAEGPPRRFNVVWHQEEVPVILRRSKEPPLYVRLPYSPLNRGFLEAGGGRKALSKHSERTGKQHWEVPMAWFSRLIRRCLDRYGQVYVIQPLFRTEVCAGSCWKAKGDLCECQCLGTNHGGGRPGGQWKEISEAFALGFSGGELACQLLKRPE